jgi:type I restriction enzyme S subunit
VIPKYAYWHLFSLNGKRQIMQDFRGATVGGISRSFTKNIQFHLPSIEDQKRIVKILDEADTLRRKRNQAVELLDDYINSTFFNMFVDESEEKNIPLVRLEKISSKITDGVHAKPKYAESGTPFISVKNITTTKLMFDDCKFISLTDHQNFTKRCRAEFDDILYTKVGATYGRACVVDTEREFSLYVSVALIKPKKELVDPTYLKAVLNSSFVKRQADKSVKGAGVPDLHLIEIKKFKIPLLYVEEQKMFAKLVLDVENIKQKMLAQSEEIENQFQALMQKAFKGAL